jgi:hypothetical protein
MNLYTLKFINMTGLSKSLIKSYSFNLFINNKKDLKRVAVYCALFLLRNIGCIYYINTEHKTSLLAK